MRILLLNDNPVVRKLVALSAQKTKDDLNVVWSADEIEHDKYDLLIVDDAHYSDEVMAVLKEKIVFERSLLMATRGNAIPAGFDHVINKPFLPTDLVELFAGIENSLSKAALKEEESAVDTQSVDLESMLEGLEDEESFDTLDLDEMFDFEEPIELSDEVPDIFKTNVLDHEEVQELQDLLDDTDEQESGDEFILDDLEFEEQAIDESTDLAEEESDDDLLAGMDHFELEDDEKGLNELDDLILEEDSAESEAAVLSDEEFGDLELQIQEAVGELGLEDLEQELEDEELEDLDIGDLDMLEETDMFDGMDRFGDLDELDSIDEREMKLAVGEAVEPEIQAEEESFSMDVREEALFESKPLPAAMEEKNSQHEGMEALNTLLKVLSSDDVVKSLKGLNISININFGNEK